jgi:hypothetical protein
MEKVSPLTSLTFLLFLNFQVAASWSRQPPSANGQHWPAEAARHHKQKGNFSPEEKFVFSFLIHADAATVTFSTLFETNFLA